MRSIRILVLAAFVTAALSAPALAATIKVPKDHETIQAAADAAAPGDKIIVSKGVYHENVVVAKDGLQFIGKKAVWDGNIAGTDGTCLTVTGNDVLVQGFRFRHGADHVVVVGSGATVKKCTFIHAGSNGVEIAGMNTLVESCTFRGFSSEAVSIEGDNSVVQKNRIVNGDSGGIDISGDNVAVVSNYVNVIEDDDAIYVSGNGARVEKNTCRNADGDGVEVSGENAVVSGNKCSYLYAYGIYVSGNGATIEKNTTLGTGDDGIYVSGDDFKIRMNKIAQCFDDSDGIYAGGSGTGPGTAVIEKNKIEDVVEDGIELSGNNVNVLSNTVTRTGGESEAAYYVSGSNNVLTGNKAIETYSDGFYVIGDANALEKCTAQGTTDDGFYVAGGVGNSVVGCTAKGNDGEGIENRGTGTILTGSKFSGNRIDVTNDGTYGEFTGNKFKTGGDTTPSETN